jgi:hypothetical protein
MLRRQFNIADEVVAGKGGLHRFQVGPKIAPGQT